MYIVPHSTPAASAATTPRAACPLPPAALADAAASNPAPPNMTMAPPSTPAQRARPAQQGREAPAREKHPQYHREGDHDRRDAQGHHLGRRFRRAQPGARREAARHAHELEAPQARAIDWRRG